MSMEKLGKQNIDPWCARTIRKVWDCRQCLHYDECMAAGHSIVPSAIEHNGAAKEAMEKIKWEKKKIEDLKGKYEILPDDYNEDDLVDDDNYYDDDDDQDEDDGVYLDGDEGRDFVYDNENYGRISDDDDDDPGDIDWDDEM